jgi:hypothetical protein
MSTLFPRLLRFNHDYGIAAEPNHIFLAPGIIASLPQTANSTHNAGGNLSTPLIVRAVEGPTRRFNFVSL